MENKIIEYNSKGEFYKSPFGAIEIDTEIRFQIGVMRSLGRLNTILVVEDDSTKKHIEIEGKWNSMKEGYDYYEFYWKPSKVGLYFYYMKVKLFGAEKETKDNTFMTKVHQQLVYEKNYQIPSWLSDGIMYQIFPDRFNRSSRYNPPRINKDYILREDWGGKPNWKDAHGVVKNNDFFGGNLKGITEKLAYLEELGVTVIYLNPITEAYSNHRYDTADYKTVDPILGTNEDFKELCAEAMQKGIKIILDGVFNHTGDDSVYFNKHRRYDNSDGQGEMGAYNSPDSKYYKWYNFVHYPEKYESWWGIMTLPNVNETEPSFMDYIIDSPDSVINHWLNLGASGYRLDVADEIPDVFLDELRKSAKANKPDCAIIGEVWEDASNKISYGKRRKYFQGHQLDSVMNYPLKEAMIRFMNTKDAKDFANEMETLREHYPEKVFYSLMNILGTHDTERILTVFLKNDSITAKRKLCLCVMLLAFLPGIPCIYYGDELGMTGEKDPQNRGCFEFGSRNPRIFAHYKDVLNLRRQIPNIGQYKYKLLQAEGGLFSFVREHEDEVIYIAVNLERETEVQLPVKSVKNFFRMGNVEILEKTLIKLGEYSGVIVRGKK